MLGYLDGAMASSLDEPIVGLNRTFPVFQVPRSQSSTGWSGLF